MDANCERMNDFRDFLSLTSTYLSCSLFVFLFAIFFGSVT